MNIRYLTILPLATLFCMMIFGAVSCKKDETPDPDNADFFIDVAFLPESETNGEVAPRLVINFNDEAAMIELRRPSSGTPMESVLLLCPDHEAMMLCGNDSLMVCATYDMETNTPSHDVLIVTPMDDDAFLLTKGFMDWNTNTLTTGDMMVLPVDDNSKNRGNRGDIDGEYRDFVFNRLVKRVDDNLDQCANFSGIITPFGIVFSYIRATLTTNLTAILYSDDPEGLYDATEFSVTKWAGSVVQDGILNLVPEKYSEVASRVLALFGWYDDGGHGKVNDYVGGGTDGFSYSTFWGQSSNAAESAGRIGIHPPAYNVSLNVSNVTENSAYLKGHFQYTSSITPVEMGYIVKVNGGPEHIEYDMNFQGITLSGLQKATKYTAFAYVKSAMGDRVLSPGVTFWTLGFEAFPNSLTFPAEGDTKYLGLSYSHEDINSWNITSKPSWCSITTDDLGLLAVTVGETTESRSGTITITAHSNALGSVTESITVTQHGSTPSGYFTGTQFDNTSWNVPYTLRTTGTETYREDEYHYVPNGGSYYTYYNETRPVNESSSSILSPSFKDNTLCLNAFLTYEFEGESIIIKEEFEGEYYTITVQNNVAYNIDNETTVTYSRYFINDNTFCIKEVSNWTYSYYADDWADYWIISNYEQESIYEFKILNNNQCTFSFNGTDYMTSNFGSEYRGEIQHDYTVTGYGTGTYEFGVKGKTVNQKDDLSKFMFDPRILMKRHH